MKWIERIVPIGFALTMAFLAPVAGGAQPPVELTAQVLPSVVSLEIRLPDGKTGSGVGFLTVKDGLLATAWDLIGQARGAVAKFSNGEEFECSGVIDKDVKRNVALVRIKTFGRPVLTMKPAEPAPGTPVAIATVKDGAFGLIAAAIGETSVVDGVKRFRLSGDIPAASTGAPVVDGAGSVVGMLVVRDEEGKAAAYAVPASSIMGLDAGLPTQPWGAASAAAAAPVANLMALEEIDARLGRAFLAVTEDDVCLAWANERTRGYGFQSGVPEAVYQLQQGLDAATASLGEIRTDNELRLRVGRALVQIIANQKAASESFIRAVVVGQQTKSWNAQSQDAQKRSNSIRQGVAAQIAALKEDLKALEAGSAKFREFLPYAQRYQLGLAERHSGFRIGVTTYPRNPFFMLIVAADGLAHKLGLRPGDKIVSVAGRAFSAADDFEELKLLIKANLGKTVPAVVERNGKPQDIRLKVPKEIPKDALYAP
jgi:S1-C subfamily serine protease